ncbi:hypothetical protein J3F83DRAFT_226246 [Trichoderma novae-zelandiae]
MPTLPLSRKIGSSDRQPICGNVANVRVVALYPLEVCVATRLRPLLHLGEDGPYDILVLHRFAASRQPVLPLPAIGPLGYTLDGVLAVAVDADRLLGRRNLQGALHGHELRSLVGLRLARQPLCNVSRVVFPKVNAQPGARAGPSVGQTAPIRPYVQHVFPRPRVELSGLCDGHPFDGSELLNGRLFLHLEFLRWRLHPLPQGLDRFPVAILPDICDSFCAGPEALVLGALDTSDGL